MGYSGSQSSTWHLKTAIQNKADGRKTGSMQYQPEVIPYWKKNYFSADSKSLLDDNNAGLS